MPKDLEPLSSEIWFRRVELIEAGALAGVEQSLRHAYHLQQIAPLTLRDTIQPAIAEDDFEKLLASGDFGAAARRLVGKPMLLELQGGNRGVETIATVVCEPWRQTARGRSQTEALAILDAWSKCVLMARTQCGSGLEQLTPRAMR
jgi:hypothetical protein